jgi:HEAT repeat protein
VSRASAAQSSQRAAGARADGSDAATLARGWTALAAGRASEAVAAADQILRRVPWSHPAIALRIEALSATDAIRGLDAYDAWIAPRKTEDAGLIEPIARAVLDQVAHSRETDLAREAVRLLGQARVSVPADLTSALSAGDPFGADAALAAKGDGPALQRLAAAAVAAETRDKTLVANALEAAGAAGVPGLESMLSDRIGPNRAAAAAALGRLEAPGAAAALQHAFTDQDPFVRSSAAVALARLHNAEGSAYVQQMLQSDVPDLQLMAAQAWNGQPGPWVETIRPLLQNRDGLNRVRAARLIAAVDPQSARRALQEALGDTNPVMRAESAKVTAELAQQQSGIADIAELRRLLRDKDASVRLYAAGALLAVVRSGS